MSKYYDTGAPFSIDNWNLLIEDVNDILQNPPEDTDCEPIDTIEPVSDPHLWSVDDVEEVRDKLKETCPEISFQEDLKIWRPEIIDEIETQMADAWCDCEDDEPDEFEVVVGSFTYTPCNAVTDPSLQGVVNGPISPVCLKIGSQFERTGAWYPPPDNDGLLQTVCDTYSTAYEAVRLFLIAMNTLPGLGDLISNYQTQCNRYTSLVDADIASVEADPSLRDTLASRICANGQTARMYQDKVDENVAEFSNQHQTGMAQAGIADAAAASNSVAALSLQGRFPTDHNVFAEGVAGAIPNWNWYDWWNPETMDVLSMVSNHLFNSIRSDTQKYGVYTSVSAQSQLLMRGNVSISIRYSPNGTWYIRGQDARLMNRDYSKPYYNYRTRWRCEGILSISCEPEPGLCNWDDWKDWGPQWWDQGWPSAGTCAGSCTGFCAYIWDKIDPDLHWKNGSETWKLVAKRPGGVKNNAAKRDEWLQKYLNWYDEHPKYDDRHEAYC